MDRDDSAEGIYRTVFSPRPARDSGDEGDYAGFALHELLSGFTDYPFISTRLMDDQENFYDVQTLPDILRSAQEAIKIERDGRADSNDLRTNPPLQHFHGKPPLGTWGPGGRIGVRRHGEFQWAPVPAPNGQSARPSGHAATWPQPRANRKKS